jgi:hypothetical protein
MTNICPYIQDYEQDVWHYLSDVFKYRLKASEIGFTNDLIYRIVSFYNGRLAGCEVYAFNDNVFEYRRGADVDLFIEDGHTGRYYFFMLQAKMMDNSGRYRDISRWSPFAQFNTLIRVARYENAFPLYLFYNGETLNSALGDSNYGLSIAEAQTIKQIRYEQRGAFRVPLITFDQVHARNMDPFSVLFCQLPSQYKASGTIEGSSIYTGYPYLSKTESTLADGKSAMGDEEIALGRQSQSIINDKNLAQYRIILKSTNEKKKKETEI